MVSKLRPIGGAPRDKLLERRQHTSAYVSICQHMSAYVRGTVSKLRPIGGAPRDKLLERRQHTSAYVSIRQHTSGGR
jgi:hypothetical protein